MSPDAAALIKSSLARVWRIANWPKISRFARVDMIAAMLDFLLLFVHLLVTVARLAGPGGLRSVVAESVLVRHQLLILNRGRKRAPNLRATDRIIAGLCMSVAPSDGATSAPAPFVNLSPRLFLSSMILERSSPSRVRSPRPITARP